MNNTLPLPSLTLPSCTPMQVPYMTSQTSHSLTSLPYLTLRLSHSPPLRESPMQHSSYIMAEPRIMRGCLHNEAICKGSPRTWTLNTITPIHKARDPMEPRNYMTIMIRHIMSKIYASLLDGEAVLMQRHVDSRQIQGLTNHCFLWGTSTFLDKGGPLVAETLHVSQPSPLVWQSSLL